MVPEQRGPGAGDARPASIFPLIPAESRFGAQLKLLLDLARALERLSAPAANRSRKPFCASNPLFRRPAGRARCIASSRGAADSRGSQTPLASRLQYPCWPASRRVAELDARQCRPFSGDDSDFRRQIHVGGGPARVRGVEQPRSSDRSALAGNGRPVPADIGSERQHDPCADRCCGSPAIRETVPDPRTKRWTPPHEAAAATSSMAPPAEAKTRAARPRDNSDGLPRGNSRIGGYRNTTPVFFSCSRTTSGSERKVFGRRASRRPVPSWLRT